MRYKLKKEYFDKIIENSKLLINLYNSSVNIVISNYNKDADMHENISNGFVPKIRFSRKIKKFLDSMK